MSFIVTSGGTAGHINPALAVAAELERLDKEVIFAGSTGGMEKHLAQSAGLQYRAFDARGFNRQKPWTLLTSSLLLARSTTAARRWLTEVQAQAVAAFGGYVSVPVGRAAVQLGIPLLIHEQNSHMGWSNKHLSKHADVIALSYEAALEGLSVDVRERVKITGNPVRPEFSALLDPEKASKLRREFRQQSGWEDDNQVLLVFGGSQGARHLNQAVAKLAPQLLKRPKLCVLQLTGLKELENTEAALQQVLGQDDRGAGAREELSSRWHLLGYCDQMPAAFAAADIVVSRAGASSLAELAVAAKPALLIPFPYATADHQRKNAESLVKVGAAQMVLDSNLDGEQFSRALLDLIDDPACYQSMLKAAQTVSHGDAATQVAELLLTIAS
ncbi:MAG: undecaprenyldiphospho-muramoylpentapeptide beta-N-acetylglucosaminyltransferase [Coriobacteriales bacterium]|jgi:UDP-N-acetylglucosamine--N-acetylmuramyl-(pentapeptide) pyrophosphoryl-undecaprenol N-acetylglucosamine transferase|nr:undecaprenyldiphospho-muramoylpentapeptide beta-N-acetylglucosaminyltransferase [Coriobacteriales bacterium]